MTFIDSKTGILDRLDEAVGGVGGAAGRKMDGMQDTVVMIATIKTIVSTEPRKGLTSWASWFCQCSSGWFMRVILQHHRMDLPDSQAQSRPHALAR